MSTTRTTEYRAHRRAGLLCCRNYRMRIRECIRFGKLARLRGKPHKTLWWKKSGADWWDRLRLEQRLLLALRTGGVHAWRLRVVELYRPGTEFLLGDLTQPQSSSSMPVNSERG